MSPVGTFCSCPVDGYCVLVPKATAYWTCGICRRIYGIDGSVTRVPVYQKWCCRPDEVVPGRSIYDRGADVSNSMV